MEHAESLRIALDGMILRGTVGSTVHGLHLEAQDDRDEMGVAIEPPDRVVGLERWEHHVERTQPEGVRSGPGDLDLVVYSARKFCRLACRGNPTVLLLLFTFERQVETELGAELRALAPAFLSRQVGDRYHGYLRTQKERLIGSRGQRRVNRPELIEAHGFDTKYAMHVLRLAVQGREMLETGRLELPIGEPERSRIRAVREGQVSYEESVAWIEQAERDLARAHERSRLPDAPDRARVDAWLVEAYQRSWRERGLVPVSLGR
jgi:predicted nucleotidyltransferase